MNKIGKKLFHFLYNIPGWNTRRKYIIFESDDWGSIRMSSRRAFDYFLKLGYPVDMNPFNRLDSLESNKDLETLLETLAAYKDHMGNPAIFTMNTVVANPDFSKIKINDFKEYYFEPFTKTLERYPEHNLVWELYQEGIKNKLFQPQFHGREHLNVLRWLHGLQNGDKVLHEAFSREMYSVHFENNPVYYNEYLDALDIDHINDLQIQKNILAEGARVFEELWGFKSKSFIANCYVWHPSHEISLNESGVKYIQGIVNQLMPTPKTGYIYKRRFHYQGQLNRLKQRYLVRNVFFEPYKNPDYDWVDDCMNRIDLAFSCKKPAIISTHRLNYIGSLSPQNRDRNINMLNKLLSDILAKWPEVEFISSDQLGQIMDM